MKQAMTRDEIKARILDDGSWPRVNLLPVKKPDWSLTDGPGSLGFIIAADEARTTVYFGNVVAVAMAGMTLQNIRKLPHRSFPSLDALLDVYMVD